jgi:hypothetical protein
LNELVAVSAQEPIGLLDEGADGIAKIDFEFDGERVGAAQGRVTKSVPETMAMGPFGRPLVKATAIRSGPGRR